MINFGLDPALSGGLGLSCRNKRGGCDYVNIVPSSKLRESRRLQYIHDSVLEFIHVKSGIMSDRNVSIAMEGSAMSGIGRVVSLGEVLGVLKHAFYVEGWDVLIVPPSSLKMFITGRGNANKQDVARSVYNHTGISISNDNITDSLGLLLLMEYYNIRATLANTGVRNRAIKGCLLIKGRRLN